MKSKQVYFKQVLKLHLLKQRIHENNFSSHDSGFVTDNTLNQTLINLKKILQIIFQYHIKNKKILFVGVPKKLELKITRLTRHIAISSCFDIIKIFSASFEIKRSINRRTRSDMTDSLLPKLLHKPDLVVLVSHEKRENFLKDCFVLKIPVIDLDSDSKQSSVLNSNHFYQVGLESKKITMMNSQNIFFIGLNFLFKVRK